MRIAVFGGTFNPIHLCHLQIASETRKRAGMDQVLFVPSNDPPHKSPTDLAPAADRYEMVTLAIAGDPAFAVSDVEIRRPDKSYSIDTIQALQHEHGSGTELSFLLGLDSFLDFGSWRRAEELLRLCHFLVVSRPHAAFRSLATLSLLPAIEPVHLESLDSGRAERLDLALSDRTTLTLLRLPPCRVSASTIRHRLKTNQPVTDMLPPDVESYIIRHGLYT